MLKNNGKALTDFANCKLLKFYNKNKYTQAAR